MWNWDSVGLQLVKFWRIGVPTWDSFSRWMSKVCILGRVKARFWTPKIVISWSTIKSPVRTRSNIILHTWILICIMTYFSQITRLFVFVYKFYRKTNNKSSLRSKNSYVNSPGIEILLPPSCFNHIKTKQVHCYKKYKTPVFECSQFRPPLYFNWGFLYVFECTTLLLSCELLKQNSIAFKQF